jgi:hypothetical protein
MRNEFFEYLEIYSVYLEIYEYGEAFQGFRFPDGCDIGTPDITSDIDSYIGGVVL